MADGPEREPAEGPNETDKRRDAERCDPEALGLSTETLLDAYRAREEFARLAQLGLDEELVEPTRSELMEQICEDLEAKERERQREAVFDGIQTEIARVLRVENPAPIYGQWLVHIETERLGVDPRSDARDTIEERLLEKLENGEFSAEELMRIFDPIKDGVPPLVPLEKNKD